MGFDIRTARRHIAASVGAYKSGWQHCSRCNAPLADLRTRREGRKGPRGHVFDVGAPVLAGEGWVGVEASLTSAVDCVGVGSFQTDHGEWFTRRGEE